MGREIATLDRLFFILVTALVVQFSPAIALAQVAQATPLVEPLPEQTYSDNLFLPREGRLTAVIPGTLIPPYLPDGFQNSSQALGARALEAVSTEAVLIDKRLTSEGTRSGCTQPFMSGIGHDESLVESWLVGGEHMGAATDVTVLSNNCPVATGFTRYDSNGQPVVRAFRWEWAANVLRSKLRISPSLPADLPQDPSRNFPNNPPGPGDYYGMIDIPWRISLDGRSIFGSAQYFHESYSYTSQQKQGFMWNRSITNQQSFNLLPDLLPNTSQQGSEECMLSSVAYDATETASNLKVVGQGTSTPQGIFIDGACSGIKGKAATTTAAGSVLQITETNPNFSYTAAISSDGTRSVMNELVSGKSKRSYFVNTVGGAPLQLKYIGNTLVETNRYSQVEALYMGNGNPASALIFGHSNLGGNPNSPQEIASSAVVWNADGNIIRTVGPALPGFAACDMENGECPWTEARDGTSYQTVVGVNFLPRDLYPNHACALPHVAPSGFPREAFIYTPSAGIQKLRDYAYTGFGSSPAGLAARAELAKWNLCDAEAVYESGSVITIAGIGVRSPDGNPANRTTQGYVIHILKPAKANLTAGSTTNVNTFYVNSIDH